jgi:hypothetical protein
MPDVTFNVTSARVTTLLCQQSQSHLIDSDYGRISGDAAETRTKQEWLCISLKILNFSRTTHHFSKTRARSAQTRRRRRPLLNS